MHLIGVRLAIKNLKKKMTVKKIISTFKIGSTLKFDKAISFISGYSSDTFKLTQKTAGALVFDGRLRIGRQFLNKHLLNNSARLVA